MLGIGDCNVDSMWVGNCNVATLSVGLGRKWVVNVGRAT